MVPISASWRRNTPFARQANAAVIWVNSAEGQMVPAFDKVVFSCPVLEPTGPLHTQFGYHIIKVLYRNLTARPSPGEGLEL